VEAIEASSFRSVAETGFDVRTMLGRQWLAAAMAQWRRSSPVKIRLTRRLAERLKGDWYFRFAEFVAVGQDAYVMTYGENARDIVLELVRWLGPGAELLEPVEWREALSDELRAMAERYA
jgi:hypothetical protein